MTKLTIVRGLPGSGKSTYAKTLNAVHVEADMYHVNENGEYDWKPENTKDGHEWCRQTVEILLRNGFNVIVSNTFTQEWEMRPYKEMGFDYDVKHMIGEYGNIHNVPNFVIAKMRDRWEHSDGDEPIG